MPNQYPPGRKLEALELLELHNHNVPIVHQLTGIPRSTLYYWRDQELSNKNVSIGQKNIPSPIGAVQQAESSPPPDHPEAELIQDGDFQYWRLPSGQVVGKLPDEERESLLEEYGEPDPPEPPPAETPQRDEPTDGVPGKTYPYPLEEDDGASNDLADFRKVRDILMNHAQQLAVNLKPDDPDINRRSLALSRILDQIHRLDLLLPSLNPEQVIRHEFVYDDMVHDKPPGMAESLRYVEFIKWQRERMEELSTG